MTLMDRRRALMAQKPSGEDWDYIWNYTDGMPEDNGATIAIRGPSTINMTPEGLAISTTNNTNSSYVAYRFPSLQTNSGAIEVDFIPPQNLGSEQNIRVGYSNGRSGFQTSAIRGVVTPLSQSTPSANLIADQVNTIRAQKTANAFWLNGNLVGENLADTPYSSNTQVMIQTTANKIIKLLAIRIRRN